MSHLLFSTANEPLKGTALFLAREIQNSIGIQGRCYNVSFENGEGWHIKRNENGL